MVKAYSQDLRERVMSAVDEGTSVGAAAPLFRVSISYIYKALGRRRATGETTARRSGGAPKPKLAEHGEALRQRIAEHSDATLAELQSWLSAERQVTVSVGCLWNTLNRLGLPLKKSHNGPPSRTGRMWPKRARPGTPAKPS
jgi:transposase